jgi:glycosyltransferase involved in cell wall biosynthesis
VSRVSFVMPAYNAQETVGEAISSVLQQTHGDVELVVVDDGSTDSTGSIASAFPEARIVAQENAGVAAARNRGIEEATSELIAFCDADDILFPQHLQALLEVYGRHGGIATANSLWLFPGGIHPSRRRYKGGFPKPEQQRVAILQQNFVSTLSLFPKSLVEEIGAFDAGLEVAEDWDFWLRAIYAGQRVFLQPKPLSLYRWGTTGLSADPERMDEHVRKLLKRALEREQLEPEERAYLKRRLAGPGPAALGRRGDEALRAGDYGTASASYREAATLCPTERPLVWKARVMRFAPRLVGPLVRSRQLRIEERVGFEEGHVR